MKFADKIKEFFLYDKMTRLLEKQEVAENNKDRYIIISLAQTLFQLSITSIAFRFVLRGKSITLVNIGCLYYLGYELRNINDKLLDYGKSKEENTNNEKIL